MTHSFYGLVISREEKNMVLDLCSEERIPIIFPTLLSDEYSHCFLWVFSAKGIGLAGTIIMRSLQANGVKICRGIKEMEAFFKSNEWKEHKEKYKKEMNRIR